MATAALQVLRKDPQAVLDYTIDWGSRGWLQGGDTIASSAWVVPSGITQDSATHAATTATVWLSGGTVGADYTITNRITTVGGRTDDRSLIIQVRER